MKKANSVIAFVFMVVFSASVVFVEYDLMMHFGFPFSVLVSVSALLVLLGALLRTPEGYEDENGFQLGALARA
jgi:hypothetical protein